MQTKTLRSILSNDKVTMLMADNEVQSLRAALRARRKRQRQNRKAGRNHR